MILFAYILLIIYIVILIVFLWAIIKQPILKIETNIKNFQKFSIIIPFKNEAKNLPALLQSLKQIDYPKTNFEIIFIDDESTDNGKEIIEKYFKILPIKLIENIRKSNSPKKDALETGIKQAEYNFIITTDADCIFPNKWLIAYNQLIQEKKPKMIIAPVTYIDKNDFLTRFQTIEFLSLQGFTKGSCELGFPFLSNGANLGFDKKTFFKLNAYEGNNNLASGDDTFLLEKFRKNFPEKIKFLNTPSAIVKTQAQKNLKSIKNQKIRWATKTKKNFLDTSFRFGLLIILINYTTILLWILIFQYKLFSVTFIILKTFIDIIFVLIINKFYQNKIKNLSLYLSAILYPFYIFWIVLWSLSGKFEWKDNKYNI